MKAILASAAGGPETLALGDAPTPAIGAGEVLIKVATSGLNGADLAQRQGLYPAPKGASEIIGLEVAGTITAVADDVSGFSVGDRVCALLAGGGYAQYCVAPSGHVLPLPKGVGFVEGAALMEALCTVWLNVFELGELKDGETLLVHGGTSGIGTAAIQLSALRGHKVWTTAGTPQKVELCKDLGATNAINYRTQDFAQSIKDSGEGVDVILDMVGGDYFEANMRCLKPGGRMIIIAFKGGRFGKVDLGRLLTRNIVVRGSTLRSKPDAMKTALVGAVRNVAWPLIESGGFRIVVDRVFPAADAAQAHAYMESGQHMGKIVLDWQ
jgi:NADPH2:quinone reductase